MKNVLKELKAFASQRVVVDISLGIIIGAALSNLVNAMVEELILPPISYFTKGMNLENQTIVLRQAESIDGTIPLEDIAIGYGKMIEVAIEFLVIGLALFFLFKLLGVAWRNKSPLLVGDTETEQSSKEERLLKKTVALLEEQNELLRQQPRTKVSDC